MRLGIGRKQQNERIYRRSFSIETEYLIATAICFCGFRANFVLLESGDSRRFVSERCYRH